MQMSSAIYDVLELVRTASSGSHKGQNGKLLIIGGSELFHAASAWSLQVAARVVDMVFYSSVPENNNLIQEAKRFFWDGMVVPRTELLSYLEEADCVLIGPGMTRQSPIPAKRSREEWKTIPKEQIQWNESTWEITNWLLAHYPQKRWVLDAGALQMVDPDLLTASMIVTPHKGEFAHLFGVTCSEEHARAQTRALNNLTILAKGEHDLIAQGEKFLAISGGNAGMTKGGSGDVLAGLVAALYCKNSAWISAVSGSFFCKTAGDDLFREKGTFFTTSELAEQIPRTMHAVLQEIHEMRTGFSRRSLLD